MQEELKIKRRNNQFHRNFGEPSEISYLGQDNDYLIAEKAHRTFEIQSTPLNDVVENYLNICHDLQARAIQKNILGRVGTDRKLANTVWLAQ